MTFQRNPSALLSIHLFFKVDVVVFCEGAASRTVEDALALTLDGRTLDTMYWANVVNVQGLPKKYHFKSVGNKATLLSIASDAAPTGTTSITVCIDADYDVQLQRMAAFPRLSYTQGYSWESDVLHRPVLQRVLTHLIGPPPAIVLAEMEHAITQIEQDLIRWCEIDIALNARAKPCVLDRYRPLSVVDLAAVPPCLSEDQLKRKLAATGYRRAPRRVVALRETNVLWIAFGKLVSKLLYHVIFCASSLFRVGSNV